MTIRLAVPTIEEDDIQAVVDVLRSGFLVQGPKIKAFEDEFAKYVGTEHCVAVTNCTCALYMMLLELGIGAGDKVAVCTYSWPATANAIRMVGADPVFVEIEGETFNMDPDALEATLKKHRASAGESGARIKAVMPVHTFGGSADIERGSGARLQTGIAGGVYNNVEPPRLFRGQRDFHPLRLPRYN